MARGLGKALESVLSGSQPREGIAHASTPFLNAHRRRIFEYLCLRPFQTNGGIAIDLKFAPTSVSWHLRSLVSSSFVVYREEGKFYYPNNFVDIEDAALFIALRGIKRRDLHSLIINSPGITQFESASTIGMSRQTTGRIAALFAEIGLVTIIHDGRFARFYPTSKLRKRQDAHILRSRVFVDWFLKKLEDEGQSPEVLRRTAAELQVKIGKGRGKGVLSIPLDPFGALAD